MALAAGARLGSYDILSSLGAGGMGEVYRARDTKLGRDVALKLLPDVFAEDPERLARFEREAKTLAALNHPNIAHIYGLDRQDTTTFIVMELVDGEDLSAHIARGAMPVDEVLPIAKQIADGLEAAHEQGIVHRDLKPANVKVRPDGVVKVLDFGLAKLIDSPAASNAVGLSQSPTITTPAMMTGVGMILGTAAYMSPEQAKGRAADKRSDIWAFGCVLYEMLTGKRAFEGEDVSDTLASVLKGQPDWTALPQDVPQSLRRILRHCLEKDRRQRLAEISIALFLMREPNDVSGAPSHPIVTPRPLWKHAIPAVVASLVVGAIVGIAAWTFRPAAPPPSVTRFPFTLPEGQQFTTFNFRAIAISPDGTQVVYAANRRLYVWSMSDLDARPIAGTEGPAAQSLLDPVFSPDGRSIAFFSPTDTAVKKVAVSGGAAVTVCKVDAFSGMDWGAEGIVFGQGAKGIMRVSANGGRPEPVVGVKGAEVMYGPQMLPGGQAVLFTLATGIGREAWDKAQIVVQSLTSGERKMLIESGGDARYLPTGHIVYTVGGVLFAVPFDLKRLQVTGGPVPIVEGVRRSLNGSSASADFSVSSTGSLIYIPGPSSPSSSGGRGLAFTDLTGAVEPLKLQPGSYESPRIAPDGKRIAFGTDDGKEAVVWIYELSGASLMRTLTFGGRNRFPIWSSDGQRIAFQSDREGAQGILWQRADGAGTAERLTKPDQGTVHIPESWSPDGKNFSFSVTKDVLTPSRRSNVSLWTFSLQDKKTTSVSDVTSSQRFNSVFSPDGRWAAYTTSIGSGQGENSSVFVQPFPATGARYQLPSGSHHPLWSPDGKELFYLPPSAQIAALSVTTQPSFTLGNPAERPRPVGGGLALPAYVRNYDITPDGKRFIGVVFAGQTPSEAPATPKIQVVLNWLEELQARVPGK